MTEDAALPRTPYGVVPAGCRLVLASENLLEAFGTRTNEGYAITAEWGDERPEGWYEPTFTVHYDQPLAASGSPEPVLDPLRVAAQAYIDWRDKRLAQWQAVAKCGHPHDGSVPCPEWDEITGESFDVDQRLDDAIRAALATHEPPAALVPEGGPDE